MSTPNPGSDEALAAGCRCPIMDNGRGKRPGPWGWVVNAECPMHGQGGEG